MRANFSNVNEELLVKYLLGEANDAEREEVAGWTNASEENKKYYEHFALIWNESKKIEATSNVNVEDAWNKFQVRRKRAESGNEERRAESEPTKVIEFPATNKFNWVRAAAILILLAGATWMTYTLGIGNSGSMMAVNSGSSVLIETLPDGSVVTMNKNSSITYNSKFKGDIRSVKLVGEAFFNVAADKEHPFVIDVNGATVTVVGTAFNVKNTGDKTVVIVESGIVDVAKNQKAVRLLANEQATVLGTRDAPIKGNSPDNLYNYYKTHEFICNNTPLPRLVEVLNEAYDVKIVLENEHRGYPNITTTFRQDSLKEVLRVLEKHGIQSRKEGDKIILQ